MTNEERAEYQTLRTADAKEIALWIRADLRTAFPRVAFTVRKERHGSIRVRWTNGPTVAQIDRLVKRYEGKGFDGMTDSTIYYGPIVTPTGERVRSYSWVFTSRDVTPDASEAVRRYLAQNWHFRDEHEADMEYWRTLTKTAFQPDGSYAFVTMKRDIQDRTA